MKYRSVVLFGALAAVVAVAAVPLAGQSAQPAAGGTSAAQAASVPRTPWGEPDLQGIWRGLSRVPLERPVGFEDKEFFTDADLVARAGTRQPRNPDEPLPESIGFRGIPLFSTAWQGGDGPTKRGRADRRTSAITDPPNGRLPQWTPQAIARREAQEEAQRGRGEADSWEDRWWVERCIVAFGPPLVTNWGMAYSGREGVAVEGSFSASPGPVMRRFIQTPGYVAITMEESAIGVEAGGYRIIPLDRRPEVGPKYRSWMGKSRGHWEGNTLVVVTKNIYYDDPFLTTFGEKPRFPATGETLTVTERYARTDSDTVEWSYTIEDPDAYVRPYTVMQYLTRDDEFRVNPELCRENNWRNMGAILANARYDEDAALKFAEDSAIQRRKRLEELKAEWAAAAAKKSSSSR